MSEAQTAPDGVREAEDLDYTQTLRRKIIDRMAEGAINSKDPDQLNAVMKAADGMDKNAFGRLKNTEKKRENATSEMEAQALAAYMIQLSENRAGNAPPPVRPGTSEVVGRTLPAEARPNYDKSLADTQASTETSAEFNARMEEGKLKK